MMYGASLIYKYEDNWIINVYKEEIDGNIISKFIKFIDFLDPELMEINNEIYGSDFSDILNDVLATLDSDPFLDDFNAHQEIYSLKNNFIDYAHPKYIHRFIDSDENQGKILIIPNNNVDNSNNCNDIDLDHV